jgi:hypothetical protein
MMQTCQEHIGNKEDPKKKKNSPHPSPKKEKSRPIMSACWDFPLAA